MDVLEAGTALDAAVISHYQLVAAIMEQVFGPIPLVWAAFPQGMDQPPQFHAKYFGHWTKLSALHIEHLAAIGAVEFHSWSPTPDDPARCRFARLLLEGTSGTDASGMKDAATAIRTLLKEEGRDAIPVLDGLGNIALWVPLADGPAYDAVRTWAHGLAARAVQEYGEILSTAFNTKADGRIHLHVSSNAVDRWSILPYSFRAKPRRVAMPISWDELQTCDVHGAPLEDFPTRLSSAGEVFSKLLQRIAARPIPGLSAAFMEAVKPLPHPQPGQRGAMVTYVTQILSDGKAHTAAEIWQAAQALHLPVALSLRDLEGQLVEYLERERATGRKAAFVQTIDHKYRINEPPDPWPDYPQQQQQRKIDKNAIIARLRATAADSANSEEFEVAVCDALGALQFLTTHVGGHAAPDGYADAPLGTMGYRVMLECKSGVGLKDGPNIFEASKYKDAYNAQYCAIVGQQSGTHQQEALSEMKTHGVSLWGVDDIALALNSDMTPLELQPAFAPGVVAQEMLPDILWAREHGQKKRVGIIAEIIRSVGWTTQSAAAQANTPADAPLLTEDAAMLLVDQELAAQGAHVDCTREEVQLAFEWLTNPLNGAAVWNAEKTAVVIVAQ